MPKLMRVILSVLAASLSISNLYAEDENERQHLLGNWGIERSKLEENGLAIEAISTNDIISNVSGGLNQTTGVLGNFDLTFGLDTEKSGLWNGGTFFLYFLGNYGKDPSTYIGDSQVTNNIEAYDTFKVYEAWYDQSLFDGKASFLFGLHDYNSEFDSLDLAGTLINSSFGIQRDISQVVPSIFSTTAVAGRLKVMPTSNLYIQTALYDGIPGNPNNPRGTHIDFRDGDGLFWGSETGLVSAEGAPHYKAAIGGWYHTAEFEDFQGNARDTNSGLYAIGESMLYNEEDNEQGLGFFFQSGFTHGDRNQVARYFGGGFSYIGLIPSQDADVFTFGIAYARNGNDYINFTPEAETAETAFELSYRMEIAPFFALQPDIQYIMNPSTDPTINDVWVLGLRTEVGL
jgi:porin